MVQSCSGIGDAVPELGLGDSTLPSGGVSASASIDSSGSVVVVVVVVFAPCLDLTLWIPENKKIF